MNKKITKYLETAETGALDLELIALLLVIAIIISTTSSFSSASKLRSLQKQKRAELNKLFFCENNSTLTCSLAHQSNNKRIMFCKDKENKPLCGMLLEQ